jgi:hypothetical protein
MERVRITRADEGDTPGRKKSKKQAVTGKKRAPVKGSYPASPVAPSPILALAVPKSILDEDLIRRFCRLIRKGLPPETACNFLNISRVAFWNWITKGEQFRNGNGEPGEFALYGAFVANFRRATAKYLARINKDLHEAGPMWAKYMTILERRDRKNYSRKEAPGTDTGTIDPDERFL